MKLNLLSKIDVAKLHKIATIVQIPGRGKMNGRQLINALVDACSYKQLKKLCYVQNY